VDPQTQALVDYALSVTPESMSDETIHHALRHNLDGVGCAAGGFSSTPVSVLRNLAASAPQAKGCSTYGVADLTVPEFAVMTNCSANRHLDYNDTGLANVGGHPNDMTPALFAAVEMIGGSGKDFLFATHVGYEACAAFVSAYGGRSDGWDQGTHIGIGTAAAVGRMLGLNAEQLGNAISLTLMPGAPLRVARCGELSHWKGCATAHAAMNAFYAVRMAQLGMTGPEHVFTGQDGFFKQISRKEFQIDKAGKLQFGLPAIDRTYFKYFPTEYNSQATVTGFLALRDRFKLEDVVSIHIATYWLSWHEIGGGQGDAAEKWDPQTREGADHSLPYLVAVVLTDGKVTLDSFTTERVRDPALRPLMNKITVSVDEEIDRRMREKRETGARIEITLKDGTKIVEEAWHPRGSVKNPMTDDELNDKYDSMIGRVLAPAEARQLRDDLWALDKAPNLEGVAANFRSWTAR
jgi:2-methylcitrate dehydratase